MSIGDPITATRVRVGIWIDRLYKNFNSIGGFSTINHLHYQIFDVRALSLTTPLEEPSQEGHVYISES